jgi:hypothetical protein
VQSVNIDHQVLQSLQLHVDVLRGILPTQTNRGRVRGRNQPLHILPHRMGYAILNSNLLLTFETH